VADDRLVAVSLLTARDLNVLGKGFARCFPLPDDASFAAVMEQLERTPAIMRSAEQERERR
jgi:hypothetical protein